MPSDLDLEVRLDELRQRVKRLEDVIIKQQVMLNALELRVRLKVREGWSDA